MDILDIMLAKAMTPQGKTESYVAKANRAAQKAEQAEADAAAAIATITAAAEDIAAAQEAAAELLETAQSIQVNMPEVYSSTGQNTDGYMTQKATTDALALKADVSALAAKADASALAGKMDTFNLSDYASKQYVDAAVANVEVTGNSGITNLGSSNAGKLVKVGNTGAVTAGSIDEADLVELLLRSDAYSTEGILGLEIDYENKSFSRLFDAANKTAGSDFDSYRMYGGRKICNVADDGSINAFYSSVSFKDDGTNGQVMIMQPKFYYQRIPMKVENTSNGIVVRKERLFLSDEPQVGFKLHPLFKDNNGNELDYVFTPVYEGSLTDNKLSSIAGVQPAANLNPVLGELAAARRGTGWHMTTAQFESANQMLQIMEYGTMNSQSAIEKGICSLPDDGTSNLSCYTGSTASIGEGTGAAASSTNPNATYDVDGKRAIRYRGMENPWGNMWHTLANIIIYGNAARRGGTPYICSTYDYATTITNNYTSLNFNLAPANGWISAMAYNSDYDWIYMPIECDSNANSAAPVGDNLWVVTNLEGLKMAAVGGNWRFDESTGIFFYACDQDIDSTLRSFGASLMFIPTKNDTYTANLTDWEAEMEG